MNYLDPVGSYSLQNGYVVGQKERFSNRISGFPYSRQYPTNNNKNGKIPSSAQFDQFSITRSGVIEITIICSIIIVCGIVGIAFYCYSARTSNNPRKSQFSKHRSYVRNPMFKKSITGVNSGILIVGTSALSPQESNTSSTRSSAPLINN